MKKLYEFIEANRKSFHLLPGANDAAIQAAEAQLAVRLAADLKTLWKTFGAISFKSIEIFGLGVSGSSHLNAVKRTFELRREAGFPASAVALEDLGDGHFAICDESGAILEWAAPRSNEPLRTLGGDVESYLLNRFEAA